jgi:dTMP kinase
VSSTSAPRHTPGRFITVEGPEGSGKTTQVARLAEHLRDRGVDVLVTREPGGTPLGEELRALLLARRSRSEPIDPLTDALLFEAARRQLVEHVVRPALAAGTVVACARFSDSTLAYQGFGAGLPLELLRTIDAAATGGLEPDLTLLLDVPAEVGLARKGADEVTRFEADHDLAFHRRVRDGFLALAAEAPARFRVIDATAPPEAVAADVRAAVDALLARAD